MVSGSSTMSTLAADFPQFAGLQGAGFQAQSADGQGGRDPRLAALDMAMAQAGLSGSTAIQEQWGIPKWARDAVNVGRDIYNVGRGLGLFSEGPEAQIEAQFLDTFLKNQVEQLIKKLHEYVNRYGNLVECVPLVTKCVQQFSARQYGSALSTGYQAYNCISSKI